MDLVVATVFVSPIVKLLITKVLAYCSDEIALLWGVKGELEKLSETLKVIEAVLHDAEKRQVESDQSVKLWLEKLKVAAYDAQDVLAELQCKLVRRKLKQKTFGFSCKIVHKIQNVNTKLDGIKKSMETFKFIVQPGNSGSNAVMIESISERSSHINDSAAIEGRKDDTSKILDLLNDCSQESYSVVRITGMGGMGKTTLAQLVYAKFPDDNSVKNIFQIKKWVSVSRKSSNREIFGDLLESNAERKSSLDVIMKSLKDRFMKGKCLIVLDDVWTTRIDVDELLKDLLSISCQGSKILMTMRSAEDITPMTDCRYFKYQLQGLPEDDCWSIIKNVAFGHGGAKETKNLSNIGKQIASKCGGLPLAAKTLGGLLYSKKNEEDWLSILKNHIWNLPTDENKIISILKLSYDHLSPFVKRCFSYCSIFPKGHYFMNKELTRMWMAQGFLISPWQSNEFPETVGNEYFKILFFNSFFQDEGRNKWGDIKWCRMHDLAVSVSGNEFGKVKVSNRYDDPEVIMQSNKFRHLSLEFLDYEVSAIPTEIYKASKVYTFVSFYPPTSNAFRDECVSIKQIFRLSLLRVLNLSYSGVDVLPQSICKLKHLRYLDISFTKIRTFPSSFNQLYNLQTLKFKGYTFSHLPKDMRKLIGLEYLIFSDEPYLIHQMPREVSKFSKLKKLSVFYVGNGNGYGIEELKDLNLLGGKLVIRNLGSITEAAQANLMGKHKIRHLQLRWEPQGYNDSNGTMIKDTENRVLHDLQPHPNLKKLMIVNFGGSKFPTWMASTSTYLPDLVHITLENCENCEHLPALGRLQSLRYLHMKGMGAVKQIGNEFYQSNEEVSFPSLVELHILSFSNLEKWLGGHPCSFSSLETLNIVDCDNLSTTPTRFPSLRSFTFTNKLLREDNNVLQTLCEAFVGLLQDDEKQHCQPRHISYNFLSSIYIQSPSSTFLPSFSGLNSLTNLVIDGRSLQSLPDGIQYLPELQTLNIGGFSKDLISFPFPAPNGSDGEQYFISLRELTIRGWPTLPSVVLPDQFQHLTSLQRFTVIDFPCLLSLPEWLGKLSSLQALHICNCRKLQYLPSAEQMLRLTSLQNLQIWCSPLLQKRCRPGNEESHKIAHLKQVQQGDPEMWKRVI